MSQLQSAFDSGTVCGLLANERRRRIIRHLSTADAPDVQQLARAVAPDDGSNGPTRVAIELRHVHLPKLADHGVVDFDPETGTVRETERTSELVAFLE